MINASNATNSFGSMSSNDDSSSVATETKPPVPTITNPQLAVNQALAGTAPTPIKPDVSQDISKEMSKQSTVTQDKPEPTPPVEPSVPEVQHGRGLAAVSGQQPPKPPKLPPDVVVAGAGSPPPPILNTTESVNQTAGSGSDGVVPKKRKHNLKLIAGAVMMLVLVIGGSAAYYLSMQKQDIRQQAEEHGNCCSDVGWANGHFGDQGCHTQEQWNVGWSAWEKGECGSHDAPPPGQVTCSSRCGPISYNQQCHVPIENGGGMCHGYLCQADGTIKDLGSVVCSDTAEKPTPTPNSSSGGSGDNNGNVCKKGDIAITSASQDKEYCKAFCNGKPIEPEPWLKEVCEDNGGQSCTINGQPGCAYADPNNKTSCGTCQVGGETSVGSWSGNTFTAGSNGATLTIHKPDAGDYECPFSKYDRTITLGAEEQYTLNGCEQADVDKGPGKCDASGCQPPPPTSKPKPTTKPTRKPTPTQKPTPTNFVGPMCSNLMLYDPVTGEPLPTKNIETGTQGKLICTATANDATALNYEITVRVAQGAPETTLYSGPNNYVLYTFNQPGHYYFSCIVTPKLMDYTSAK